MKVKVPREIRIGAYTYTVHLDSSLNFMEACVGTCHHGLSRIIIEANQAPMHRNITLLHEVEELGKRAYRIEIGEADLDRMAETMMEFLLSLGIELDWSDIEGV